MLFFLFKKGKRYVVVVENRGFNVNILLLVLLMIMREKICRVGMEMVFWGREKGRDLGGGEGCAGFGGR